MEFFATDRDRLAFLLETDAALDLDFEALEAQAEAAAEEPSPEQRAKYITTYIGSMQKLVDWIWKHTPEGVESVVDAFSGSAVVAYMYKTKDLRVLANDRLRYCHHAARAIIENDKVRLSDEDLEALLADNAKAGTLIGATIGATSTIIDFFPGPRTVYSSFGGCSGGDNVQRLQYSPELPRPAPSSGSPGRAAARHRQLHRRRGRAAAWA